MQFHPYTEPPLGLVVTTFRRLRGEGQFERVAGPGRVEERLEIEPHLLALGEA